MKDRPPSFVNRNGLPPFVRRHTSRSWLMKYWLEGSVWMAVHEQADGTLTYWSFVGGPPKWECVEVVG